MKWLQAGLWLAVIVSALIQVLAVQWHRDLLQEWQKADRKRQTLQQEYSRLLQY